MATVKRLVVSLIVLIATAAAGGIAYLNFFTPKQRPAPAIRVQATPELLARGRYLVVNVLQCIDCHSERDWTLYGGPPKPPIGAGRACMTKDTKTAGITVGQEHFPGVLCIRNITPDFETGIGAWSDGEIMRAVREGVGEHGQALFPIMPYFILRNLADSDMQAVVAYLRTLTPVQSARPDKQIDFPLNLLYRLWPEPLTGPVSMPDRADHLAYGEYLARVARCEFCHSPRKANAREFLPGRRFAGGQEFALGPKLLYSKNLTPHETGLGPWTKDAFIARFRMYQTPRPVAPEDNTLMNWNAFAGMTEADLGAIYDFLRTLPPVATQNFPRGN